MRDIDLAIIEWSSDASGYHPRLLGRPRDPELIKRALVLVSEAARRDLGPEPCNPNGGTA